MFHIINELTGAPADDIVGQVLRERGVVELANHTALIHRDGRIIPVEDSAAPITDRTGQITGAVLVFHDVTERRRVEEERERLLVALQRQTAELDAILDSIADGLAISDGTGKVTRTNAAAERLLRQSSRQMALDIDGPPAGDASHQAGRDAFCP